jgi:hypothetical protein
MVYVTLSDSEESFVVAKAEIVSLGDETIKVCYNDQALGLFNETGLDRLIYPRINTKEH